MKQSLAGSYLLISASHPVWVRGLKLELSVILHFRPVRSHPVWVRGLKLLSERAAAEKAAVAPRVGAWIETGTIQLTTLDSSTSHPVWVRGLKLFQSGV